jgi:hypothetical protein
MILQEDQPVRSYAEPAFTHMPDQLGVFAGKLTVQVDQKNEIIPGPMIFIEFEAQSSVLNKFKNTKYL